MKQGNDRSKKAIKFLGAGIGLVAAATAVTTAAYKLTENVIHPKTVDYHKHYNDEVKAGNFNEDWFHRIEKEEFLLPSVYGYDIHGFYFPNHSKKTIILVHGITASLWSAVKYMKIFHDLGYNAIIYDQRNHGLSGGDFTTLGMFEKMDTKRMVEYAKEKDGDNIVVGLHGESMGAATVMMASAICDVDFIIEDCGFTSGADELKFRLKDDYSLPGFPLMNIASLYAGRRFGFSFKKDSPKDAVKKCDKPMLFVHGGEDTYVPTFMVNELYEAKDNKKMIKVFQGSKHAVSYVDHKEEYIEIVHEFLNAYGF